MSKVILLVMPLLFISSVSAGIPEGVRAFNSGDYEKAYQELSPAAKSGDTDAIIILAGMHMLGLGVEKDRQKAKRLYFRAERHDSSKAAIVLSTIYLAEDDVKSAKTILRKHAKRGNAGVALILGSYYESGQFFEKNDEKAKYWYRVAADSGSQKAKQMLNSMENSKQD